TKPAALALIGRDALSGASLCVRQSTFIASKPAHACFECPSEAPASMRLARPTRTWWKASSTASVPVTQALEFVVTRFPRASSPPSRAVLALHCVCSGIVLPSRPTRPASVHGTSFWATVSMPPNTVPMIAPLSQSTSSTSCAVLGRPASVHASMAAIAAYLMHAFIAKSSSSARCWRLRASTPSGMAPTWQANLLSRRCSRKRTPLFPSRSARANASLPFAFGATTPSPVTTTRSGITTHHHGAERRARDRPPVGEGELHARLQLAPPPEDLVAGRAHRLARTNGG